MRSLETPPVLAEAADLLGTQLRVHIERLGELMQPHARGLERQFLAGLRKLGFDARQRKAMAAITLGAAARIMVQRRPLADFFEQVEYNGRRLAKLDLPPGAVLGALRDYDRLAAAVFRKLDPAEQANLDWAAQQLNFCVVLTLNNAFYQMREAETAAFYELYQAELEARSQRELLERSLGTLARFCQADAGCLVLPGSDSSGGLALQTPGQAAFAAPAAVPKQLAAPRLLTAARASQRLLLDPGWRGRFASVWSIPLRARGGLAGAVQFGFSKRYEWLPRERKLLTLAAERCLLASEKLRLAEDLAARERQIRDLAAHMLEVEERERRRIGRELHDEAGQVLLYLRLQLDMVERAVRAPEPVLRTGLAEARELIDRAVLEMRRLISDLSPAVLEQLGLAAAIRQLVNRFRQLYRIEVELRLPRLGRLPRQTEVILYRLVQECCSNVARHASASHVKLWLTAADGWLKLRVEDDGVGFRVEEALARRESFGLAGMRERVALAGGTFAIDGRPGRGAVVAVELPVSDKRPALPAFQRTGCTTLPGRRPAGSASFLRPAPASPRLD